MAVITICSDFGAQKNKVSHVSTVSASICHEVMGPEGDGNGTPLQYSCLENPMDGGAWKAAVHGVAEGRTRLSDFPFTFHFHALEKEMETHSTILAWRIPGTGSLVGCRLCGRTESDTTDATQQQVRPCCCKWQYSILFIANIPLYIYYRVYSRQPVGGCCATQGAQSGTL